MKKGTKKGRLSQDNFDWFKHEIGYWADFLGCTEWDVRCFFKEDEEALAFTSWSGEDKIASFTLAKTWEKDEISNWHISKVAFHEMCEILLSTLASMANQIFRRSKVDEEVHIVIRKLENTIFEDEWSRRFPKLP